MAKKLFTRTFTTSNVTIKRASTGEVLKEESREDLPLDIDKAKAKAAKDYHRETKEFDFVVEVTQTEEVWGITPEAMKKYGEKVVRPASQQKGDK